MRLLALPQLPSRELEIDDDGVSSPSDAATAVCHPTILISHEIKRVKFGLITEGLNSYKADNYEKAREDFQHAFEMGPDVPVLSFDDTMTEERLNLWVCLSTLRAARLSQEPQRSFSLKQARSLLEKTDDQRKSSPSPRAHLGRHIDAIFLAEIHLYSDALPEAERICTMAGADIESTLGIEHPLFYTVALTNACIHYAKGHVGPALQWLRKLPAGWLPSLVQPFFDSHSTGDNASNLFLLAVNKERFDVAICMLKSTPALGLSTNGPNFLYEAAAQGSLPIITLLVAAGSSIHARGRRDAKITDADEPLAGSYLPLSSYDKQSAVDKSPNDTALFVAIRNDQLSAVRLLIDLHADIESLDRVYRLDGYCTALGFAIIVGHKDIVKLLLDRGAKPNPRVPRQESRKGYFLLNVVEQPLLLATISQNKWDDSLAPLLIERGADVNYGRYFVKPLIQAIRGRATQNVIQLLAAGASVNTHPNDLDGSFCGHSPLHTAIKYGTYGSNPEIIEELLKKGAEVNYSNYAGDPPLISAIIQKDQSLVDHFSVGEPSLTRRVTGRTPPCWKQYTSTSQILCVSFSRMEQTQNARAIRGQMNMRTVASLR